MDTVWGRLGIRFSEPVRDPLWRNVMLPPEFSDILASPEFVKLSRVMQLGPAHLVYPGATHTRRAHSLGVFELAKRVLEAVSAKGGLDFVSPGGARSFLAAALCHDLGHFPYAHSLKELPLRDHEALTAEAVAGPLAAAVSRAGADPVLVAAIVDKGAALAGRPRSEREELALYRALLSGVLDPDKLDYLNRDAWACGVPYGLQDVDFVLQHIGIDADGRPGVGERGVMAVEAVLFSKYQMYKAVYWHKSVRAATAMIKKAVVRSLASGAVRPAELYGLDDAGFYALMSSRERDDLGLIRAVFDGALLKPCLELPFDPSSRAHALAADLGSRPALEDEIARAAFGADRSASFPSNVVIDVPEPISFESDMPILGARLGFSDFTAVFRPEVVSSFTSSLRVLRVFAPPESPRVAEAARERLGS